MLRAFVLCLLTAAGVWAGASVDWCDAPARGEPRVESFRSAEGPLLAGSGRVAIAAPLPIVVAGYAPPRPTAARALRAPEARALVVEVSGFRVGLVNLDLLIASEELVAAIRQRAGSAKLEALWVSATHTHSSLGGFEQVTMAELAGTGRFRADAREAVVKAAAQAVEQAAAQLAPASVAWGERRVEDLVVARSGPEVDPRLSRVVFSGAQAPIAEVVLLAGHPTLAGRDPDGLAPDYPGALAALEAPHHGVALVLQSAVGNASVLGVVSVDAFAERLTRELAQTPLGTVEGPIRLALSQVSTPLPRADASRLLPGLLRRAGDNFLCVSAPKRVEVSVLQLGPFRWVSIPGEPTAIAARALEQAAGANRVVALTNGYVGYVDDPKLVAANDGEAGRQYFGPELLERLTRAAALAAERIR